jgi:hypothetical protein
MNNSDIDHWDETDQGVLASGITAAGLLIDDHARVILYAAVPTAGSRAAGISSAPTDRRAAKAGATIADAEPQSQNYFRQRLLPGGKMIRQNQATMRSGREQ